MLRLAPLAVLLLACTHAGITGTPPQTRDIPRGEGQIETDVTDEETSRTADAFARQDIVLSAVWTIPNAPDLRLAVITREPEGDRYGPQLAAIRADTLEVVHETARLFDDDFINPTFFRFEDRVLMLADHGSEDAYGSIAWSFEHGRVRDLGELAVALVEDIDVFTRGAGRHARVELRDGVYIVRIRGPLLADPRGKSERLIANRWQTATFTLPAPP